MSHNSTNLLSEPDLTGLELGDFTIICRLGRGGMADVYLAEQVSLKRKIALKVLHQSLASDPTYVKRFKNEAQAAAALTHPNIVQIYEVGTLQEFHYISQEFIDGENLKEYLVKHKSVSTFMAISTLRQVAAALHKAKEQGVIHRDIKPENILVTADGDVKVADFGLARIKRSTENQELTQVGMTMGTPLYMSPEQAEGGDVDHRSDIYSLGITAYHMIAGRPPFEKETALATAIAHKTAPAPSLFLYRPDVPPELAMIIEKMMAKLPEDRYKDCGGIIKDLLGVPLDNAGEFSDAFKALTPSEAKALYASHLEATQKLDRVVHGKQDRNRNLIFAATILLLTIASFFGGSFLALLNPPKPLLDSSQFDIAALIPKQGSVKEQFDYAEAYDDADPFLKVDAYKSVEKYYPYTEGDDKTLRYRLYLTSEIRIGNVEYDSKNYESALETFESVLKKADQIKFPVQHDEALGGMILVLAAQSKYDEIRRYKADVQALEDRMDVELFEKLQNVFDQIKTLDAKNPETKNLDGVSRP